MFSQTSQPCQFERDCQVVMIPSGDEFTLPVGTVGYITQSLGGSFTVFVDGNLFRVAGADAVAQAVTQEELDSGMLYPSVVRLGQISRKVAASVMTAAGEEGVGDSLSPEAIEDRIITAHWRPHYRRYVPA